MSQGMYGTESEIGLLTHSDHLYEVRVIHLEVQKLLAAGRGHSPSRTRYDIEYRPKCFDDLPINPSGTGYEERSIARKAGRLVTMNMPNPDPWNDFQIIRNVDQLTVAHPVAEFLHVCAVYIVEAYSPGNTLHVVL